MFLDIFENLQGLLFGNVATSVSLITPILLVLIFVAILCK